MISLCYLKLEITTTLRSQVIKSGNYYVVGNVAVSIGHFDNYTYFHRKNDNKCHITQFVTS